MAFAAITGGTSGQSSTANQSTIGVTFDKNYNAGEFLVVIMAMDNNQTTDGDEGAVSSMTDTKSNVWSKGAEFTNGQTAAQAGATCSIWYSLLTTQLLFASDSATVNLTNSASRDKTAWSVKGFTIGGGNTVSVEGTPGTLPNDAADPGSLNVTTANIECLRVRGIAAESSSTTALTTTDGTWTAFTGNTTSGGGSAANMAVRGEWKISTATGDASNPTLFAADCASVYLAFKEVVTVFNTQQRKQTIVRQAVRRASSY